MNANMPGKLGGPYVKTLNSLECGQIFGLFSEQAFKGAAGLLCGVAD